MKKNIHNAIRQVLGEKNKWQIWWMKIRKIMKNRVYVLKGGWKWTVMGRIKP